MIKNINAQITLNLVHFNFFAVAAIWHYKNVYYVVILWKILEDIKINY